MDIEKLKFDEKGLIPAIVVDDETGKVLARDKRRGANAFDTSPAEASARLNGAIDVLRCSLPEGAKVASIFGAVASVTYYPEILRRAKRIAEGAVINFDEDVMAVLAAGLGKEEGVCVICGTGSSCFMKMGKEIVRIGGYGKLLKSAFFVQEPLSGKKLLREAVF